MFYGNRLPLSIRCVNSYKTRSMTRIQNHDDDDASSRNMLNTCDRSGVAPWLEINHDLLYLVMMQLGVVDFVAFSGVCKSWRSLALSNWNSFMASKPPMSISISTDANEKEECYLCLEDFDGRNFKTMIPHSAGRNCVGLTCGYLILFGKETNDFWLVNPITRHRLHFPCVPNDPEGVKAILVFSTSLSKWVLVMLKKYKYKIWFSIAGTRAWNHVSSTFPVIDLHAFKGKIYTLKHGGRLYELRLTPEPKLMLLETKNFLEPFVFPRFISSCENIILMRYSLPALFFHELDLGKMKWVCSDEASKEYVFYHSNLKNIVAVKPESWADPLSQYGRYVDIDERRPYMFNNANMWYFPHDCLNARLIHD